MRERREEGGRIVGGGYDVGWGVACSSMEYSQPVFNIYSHIHRSRFVCIRLYSLNSFCVFYLTAAMASIDALTSLFTFAISIASLPGN
jgi:hypothetical protein